MRLYMRTGRHTSLGLGPIGLTLYLLIALPIYAMAAIAWVLGWAIYILARAAAPILKVIIYLALNALEAAVKAHKKRKAQKWLDSQPDPRQQP